MRQKSGSPRHQEEARSQGLVVSAAVTREEPEGDPERKKATEALAIALKSFAATLSQHTEHQSDIAHIFGSALRQLSTELQKSKTKVSTLEVRLREAEMRIGQLEKAIGAWTRQGPGWLQ